MDEEEYQMRGIKSGPSGGPERARLNSLQQLPRLFKVGFSQGLISIYERLAGMYRVTIQLVQNLPLTTKQKLRFGLTRPGKARPKRHFCFEVNGRFCTT